MMYSGSDSTESQKFSKWAINPSAYQNMAQDQVDWAALAQQWIIMKEAGPPPIPGEQSVVLNKSKESKEELSEGGEAPMEVENEKDGTLSWNTAEGPLPQPGAESWNWSAGSQNWAWNNTWTPPSGVPPPPGVATLKPPLLPTPNNIFTPPETGNDNAVPFGGYNTAAATTNEYNSGYWTSSGVQQKEIKPHNKRYSKVNVPIKAPVHTPPAVMPIVSEMPVTATLDAAKRKQLPAWIREGLEKMERDKLKQMEKEREKQVRDEYTEKMKQNEKEKMEILKTTMKEQRRSKFESDGENSEEEATIKKRQVSPGPVPLTPDELMIRVRKTMTEILLNVTNHYIEQVCKEEHQRYVKKIKASDQLASAPSGAVISAKLGLGVYDDGSSSSEEEEAENVNEKLDSDSELKDTIKRRMMEFAKTEKEIEEKLTEADNRKMDNQSRPSTPGTNENDSQVDAHLQGRKYELDDKNSPKSKDRTSSMSSLEENYLTARTKRRRSSSYGSNDSHKRSKRKYYNSRSKSRSPERKYRTPSYRYSKSPPRKRRSRSRSSRRDSTDSRRKSYRRSRSRSYSRSRRSRSSSYRGSTRSYSKRSRSRERSASRNRISRSKRSRSRSDTRLRRRRSRSSSSGRGKRSHRH